MSECVCPIAGYCDRHKVAKTTHWHRLCQTREDYRALWDANKGPGCEIDQTTVQIRRQANEQRLQLCRSLWTELHNKQDPTPKWFSDWVSRVPNFGCGCRSWLREYLRDNPPDFDGFIEWSIDLHNAVNAKLGKPVYPKNT